MAHLDPGDKVRIHFEKGDQFTGNPARRFNGQEHVIARRREISYGVSGALRGTEYYLEDVVSPYGMQYAFLEEHLIKI